MSKIVNNIQVFKPKLKNLKRKNKKIILCHGVFDVLHLGHISHFRESKKLGDILIVSVTSDKFVNKGPSRPVFNLNMRMQMLSSIQEIDFVISNHQQTPINLIKILKPDFYCKGKDYKNNKDDITGNIKKEQKAIKSVGGSIYYTKSELMSSSNVINRANLVMNPAQEKFVNIIKNKVEFNSDKKILRAINSFSDLKILLIGETIIDEYVFCETLGKSGKEPVLVLRDLYKERYLGGAAALAKNLSSLCKKITLVSNIGEKNQEKTFIKNQLSKNIKPIFLKKDNSPTIIKKRYLDDINRSKLLGVYSLNDQSLSLKNEILFKKIIEREIKKHDLVIVSDYGHGFISQKLANFLIRKSKFLAVNTQVNASNIGYHVISKYKGASFITINETELRHELRDKSSDVKSLIKKISNNLKTKFTNITCGDEGSYIYSKKTKKITHCPAFANKVIDKVGTGDTMMILIAICLFKKVNLEFTMFISAIAAAQNLSNMANKKTIEKHNFIKALQSYLK